MHSATTATGRPLPPQGNLYPKTAPRPSVVASLANWPPENPM